MYQSIISGLVFFMVFVAQVSVGAQENEIKYIFNDPNTQDYIKRIDFVNKKTKAVVNTYDVIENNPYNHLKYPVTSVTLKKNKEYNISNINGKDINYFVSSRKPLKINDLRPMYAHSEAIMLTKQKVYTAISYVLMTLNSDRYVINYHTTTKILNNDGKIMKTFDHLNYDDIKPIVSQDGKYYALNDSGDAYDGNYNQEYRIYDIATGQLLYQETKRGFEEPTYISLVKNGVFAKKKMGGGEEMETQLIDIEYGYIATFIHDRESSFSTDELLKLSSTVREDFTTKKTTNSTFKIEKFNFYQSK